MAAFVGGDVARGVQPGDGGKGLIFRLGADGKECAVYRQVGLLAGRGVF